MSQNLLWFCFKFFHLKNLFCFDLLFLKDSLFACIKVSIFGKYRIGKLLEVTIGDTIKKSRLLELLWIKHTFLFIKALFR